MEGVGCGVGVGSVESSPSFWLTKVYVSPDFVNTTVLSLYPSALITTVLVPSTKALVPICNPL